MIAKTAAGENVLWWQALPAGPPPGVTLAPLLQAARDGLHEGRPLTALEHVLGTAALLKQGVKMPFLDADPRWQRMSATSCDLSAARGEDYPWTCLHAGFVAVFGEEPGGRLYDALCGAKASEASMG